MPDPGEELSYEALQEMLRAERRSNRLMPVSARFWPEVRDFLHAVTQEFRQAQQADPWSRKAMLLSDEVKNAKHAAENLWILRERKLAMLALARERERKRPEGVTADEAQLWKALHEVLDSHRRRIFEGTVSEPGPAASAAAPSAPVAQQPPAVAGPGTAPPSAGRPASGRPLDTPPRPVAAVPAAATPPAGGGDEQVHGRGAPADLPRAGVAGVVVPPDQAEDDGALLVRALSDIPQFVGPDMQTYLLKEGDLATLPRGIAELLVRRKKAALVEA